MLKECIHRGDDRLVLLHIGGEYAVVDVRGCVFEFVNSTEYEMATLHVSGSGVVSAARDVKVGDELLWAYEGDDFVC